MATDLTSSIEAAADARVAQQKVTWNRWYLTIVPLALAGVVLGLLFALMLSAFASAWVGDETSVNSPIYWLPDILFLPFSIIGMLAGISASFFVAATRRAHP
jgi:hypothetical protein